MARRHFRRSISFSLIPVDEYQSNEQCADTQSQQGTAGFAAGVPCEDVQQAARFVIKEIPDEIAATTLVGFPHGADMSSNPPGRNL